MPTSFTQGAVYHPETLKRAGQAFDSAWPCIARDFEPAARAAAQLKLATIILQLAADANSSPLELKCRAIGAMHAPDVGRANYDHAPRT